MARTIAEIQNQIIAQKETYTDLDGLTSTSQTSKWRLLTYIVAVAISIFEQILDLFKTDIETKLVNKVSGTKAWIENNLMLFQYSSTDPQIVEISDTYEISYPVIDADLQIVSQVALEVLDNNLIQIKVAKNEPPEPLTATELLALEGYMDEIMPAGIQTYIISSISDKILIEGTIYYNGMYSSIIKTNVETAIKDYIYNLPFGGRYVQSECETAILNVAGVKDINITRVQVRRNSTSFVYGGNTSVYVLEGTTSDVNTRYYTSYTGYLIPETTTNYTLSDTLTYVTQ